MKSAELIKQLRDAYRVDETEFVQKLIKDASLPKDALDRIHDRCKTWVEQIRHERLNQGGLDAFLERYDLSSEEGIALMCLAEALLRIPDKKTIDALIKDKIAPLNWQQHLKDNPSFFVNAATYGLMLTGKVLNTNDSSERDKTLTNTLQKLVARLGEPFIRMATLTAMKILGRQFVMGETIEKAIKRAKPMEAKGYLYSYDMLGEAAKTERDAEIYFAAYQHAIQSIAASLNSSEQDKTNHNKEHNPMNSPGISVKLSALHPRYEWVNRERMQKELLPKLIILVKEAKAANIGFTIDAEEADRLELSLCLAEELFKSGELNGWQGFGMVVQAYQKRAPFLIDYLSQLARTYNQKMMIRLVKGAYWDSEIKWSQEKGLSGYPVYTRKASTDVAYLACVKKLFAATDVIFPQFATHNAYTAAAVLEMCPPGQSFEFQRLHGMGEPLYDKIVGSNNLNIPCRIYAPVGGYDTLLAYLVRRLLENGANTSFVNRIIDQKIPIETLVQNPIETLFNYSAIPHPKIPLPVDIYMPVRTNSSGIDLSNPNEINPILEQVETCFSTQFKTPIKEISMEDLDKLIERAHDAQFAWDKSGVKNRAACLEKMANLLEAHQAELLALLIREGGKTFPDAIAEYREAIDFCHYYRDRLQKDFAVKVLPGPTGEYNQLSLHGRGVIVCISPWNFPLAIFLGQVVAALAAGNTVIAKPAGQTPYIALKAIELLHEAGVPKDCVQVAIGPGSKIGNALVEDLRTQGILFTGSTETARGINQKLANRQGPLIPFIAETGGQNALIVDSTALPEQVITDVVTSAFNSAGQRCSALRVVYLQNEIADKMIDMLKGSMAELKISDPFLLSTDIGPVIDEKAKATLEQHGEWLAQNAKLIYMCQLSDQLPNLPRGSFFAPRAYEIPSIRVLKNENFGPILHVIRYDLNNLNGVIEDINSTGFGLTFGIHSRIAERVDYIRQRIKAGNTYVNRNMIGAVVGVQPFGGEGLSGTGPKAGGPHMLPRLAIERTLSINTTAAGGNASLLSIGD